MQEMVEVVIRIPKKCKEFLDNGGKVDWLDAIPIIDAIANGTVLPEGHGKIVDLGKIDEDRIDKDNPVITINTCDSSLEVISLDYLYSLPDLIKKEERQ